MVGGRKDKSGCSILKVADLRLVTWGGLHHLEEGKT